MTLLRHFTAAAAAACEGAESFAISALSSECSRRRTGATATSTSAAAENTLEDSNAPVAAAAACQQQRQSTCIQNATPRTIDVDEGLGSCTKE